MLTRKEVSRLCLAIALSKLDTSVQLPYASEEMSEIDFKLGEVMVWMIRVIIGMSSQCTDSLLNAEKKLPVVARESKAPV